MFIFIPSSNNYALQNTSTILATPDKPPIITGGKARYQIGDMVRLNCTSGRSKPAAHLQWFINGEQAESMLTRQYETIVTGREGKVYLAPFNCEEIF